jgi:NAD(P)-dependent dehydrogenase (short-subunit alcohol dehydrogenase family)
MDGLSFLGPSGLAAFIQQENVMAQKLEGKIALVTGGSTGIGLAAAKRFAEEGAHVFIAGRRQQELDAALKEIDHNAVAIRADVSSTADRICSTP